MTTVYDLSLDQLTERLVAWGEPAFRAKQIHRQLWHRAATYDRTVGRGGRLMLGDFRHRFGAELR